MTPRTILQQRAVRGSNLEQMNQMKKKEARQLAAHGKKRKKKKKNLNVTTLGDPLWSTQFGSSAVHRNASGA